MRKVIGLTQRPLSFHNFAKKAIPHNCLFAADMRAGQNRTAGPRLFRMVLARFLPYGRHALSGRGSFLVFAPRPGPQLAARVLSEIALIPPMTTVATTGA
jgi:hypothetical protein